jgi:hypothetical protein
MVQAQKVYEQVVGGMGYLAGYLMFTTVLYLVLTLSHQWTKPYSTLMAITLGIPLVGILIRRSLQ